LGLRELNARRLKLGHPRLSWKATTTAPVSDVTLRVRRHRDRRAAGRISLMFDVDEISTVKVLAAANLLDPQRDHSRADISRAVEQLLELLANDSP
jgi:hypothetical protein